MAHVPRPPADEETTTEHSRVVGPGYVLGKVLGRGGTAVVFEASHPEHAAPLAVKVIVDRRLHGTRAFAALYEQARMVAALRSANIVRVLDAGRAASGEPFVVMEKIDGVDLAHRLRTEGALRVGDALRVALDVCCALAEIHAAGLVHQDIKPSNLVLARTADGRGHVKVIDLGTTVPAADRPEERLVTGSPGYASPEQLDGVLDVDVRADVWAIGVVLFELVTGLRLFEARTLMEARAATLRAPVIPPMTSPHGPVPQELEAIVRRCLEIDRERRFPTVAELTAALVVALAAEQSEPRKATTMRTRIAPSHAKDRAMRMALWALGPLTALATLAAVRLALALAVP